MASEKNVSPALGLVLIAVAVFAALSLISYHPGDAGHARSPGAVLNYGGKVGAWLSLSLLLLVGWSAYGVPILLLGEGVARLIPHRPSSRPFWLNLIYEITIVLSLASLFTLQNVLPAQRLGWQLERIGPGGYWGQAVANLMLQYLGLIGTRLVLATILFVSASLLTEMKPLIFLARQVRRVAHFFRSLLPARRRVSVTPRPRPIPLPPSAREAPREKPAVAKNLKAQRDLERERKEMEREKEELLRQKEAMARERERERQRELEREQRQVQEQAKEEKRLAREKLKAEKKWEKEREKEKRKAKVTEPRPVSSPAPSASPRPAVAPASGPGPAYQLPRPEFLLTPPPLSEREIKDDIEVNSKILESTLADFGIEARVIGAERGPAITRYELQPAPGVKVQKIKALDNDIALAMKATSVRILAPIPGKAAIGIEVPNSCTTLVYMREMIESDEYQKASALLPLAIGKDISGNPIVADLTEMPHLLIAGATGSGKTVCMNSIIISLLFSRTPDEMKFILVDPKKVEMTAYLNLPHLICPVVTDATRTSLALAWLVKEMEDRYELFSRVPVRNIQAYNSRKIPGQGEEGEELPASIPYVVLLIDELADLMLTAPVEIENAIARLAHLSRAVGIHMILATQRPSVDVITGVIKANFPARLSFKVAARVDSRTVLDASGADKLLGNGDLLFLPPGSSRMIRAQGTFCRDAEIETVVKFVNQQRSPEFQKEIFQKGLKGQVALGGGEDILLEAAVEVIKQTGQASVSVLQRKLKIGYSRAARIIDILEERGIVGPYQGAKAREILIETYGGGAGGEDLEEEE